LYLLCAVCVLYCFCNFVCCVLFECGVLFCVLCLIVVPLPLGANPFAVKNKEVFKSLIIVQWDAKPFTFLLDHTASPVSLRLFTGHH
jgi:hypothetical protein